MGRTLQAFAFLIIAPDPVASKGPAAEILEWGTDRDVYKAGESPVAFIEIRNTGDHTISDAVVRISVSRKTPLGAITLIRDKEYKASAFLPGFNVPPGKSKRFELSPFRIPDTELAKGTYEMKADITIGNSSVGSIRKTITVK